jgi:hypothetical protein
MSNCIYCIKEGVKDTGSIQQGEDIICKKHTKIYAENTITVFLERCKKEHWNEEEQRWKKGTAFKRKSKR